MYMFMYMYDPFRTILPTARKSLKSQEWSRPNPWRASRRLAAPIGFPCWSCQADRIDRSNVTGPAHHWVDQGLPIRSIHEGRCLGGLPIFMRMQVWRVLR